MYIYIYIYVCVNICKYIYIYIDIYIIIYCVYICKCSTAFSDCVHWMRIGTLCTVQTQMLPEAWHGTKSVFQLFLLRIWTCPPPFVPRHLLDQYLLNHQVFAIMLAQQPANHQVYGSHACHIPAESASVWQPCLPETC